MEGFELHRRLDGLVYEFNLVGPRLYSRVDDPRMTIRWEHRWGWVARSPDTGDMAGRPWDVLPEDQGRFPPTGLWISRKGDKSYVYDLVHA